MVKITHNFDKIEDIKFEDQEIEINIRTLGPLPFAFPISWDISPSAGSEVPWSAIESGLKDAIVKAVIDELPRYLDASIVENRLVDTGALRDSLIVARTPSGLEIRYTAPYAGLLHEGGYIQPYGNQNAEKVFIPGRPWIAHFDCFHP